MQYTIGQVSGSCPQMANTNPDGTHCDQFGAVCRVWECTDYFMLEEGVYVLKWSDQVRRIHESIGAGTGMRSRTGLEHDRIAPALNIVWPAVLDQRHVCGGSLYCVHDIA